jgi:hypothetical protein
MVMEEQDGYFFVVVEEGNEDRVKCESISLVAFRPKMRALNFESKQDLETAIKELKELDIKFEQ